MFQSPDVKFMAAQVGGRPSRPKVQGDKAGMSGKIRGNGTLIIK
jgi:hypothetical protein